MEFTELMASENGIEMSLYVKTSDGNMIHVRDYDFYYDDYQFGLDDNGSLVEVYSHYSVSYALQDGKLFEFTYDMYGVGDESEITLPMLLAHASSQLVGQKGEFT